MLQATLHPLGQLGTYHYVAILSQEDGSLLLSRHCRRSTWEPQGGHIEPGESPEAAARRELYEESGALAYTLAPLCDYAAAGTNGVCYTAVIHTRGALPPSEIEEVRLFRGLPPATQLTYPGITPLLYAAAQDFFAP